MSKVSTGRSSSFSRAKAKRSSQSAACSHHPLHVENLEGRTLFSSNLTIMPKYASSITSLSNAATIESVIQASINSFETHITSNAPVSVTVNFADTNSGLGSTTASDFIDIPYATYLADLQANPNKSASDKSALASMTADPYPSGQQIEMTAADLGAIGDTADEASALSQGTNQNGTISLNLGIINVTRPDADPNEYDLQSVVTHEMDEVLGTGGAGSSLYEAGDVDTGPLPTDIGSTDPFRYTSTPGVRSFTTSFSATSYFSIDGGKTDLVNFNQQGGGGADYGDWGNPDAQQSGNTPPQIQDAYGTPGAATNLGVNEFTALDVVGWNLIPQGTAPAVTTNPLSQSLTVGQDAKFTAAASGSPTPTVQWKVETAGTNTFTTISGATSTTLDLGPATLAESGNKYEAIFSNGIGSPATSTAAILTVGSIGPSGKISGSVFADATGNGLSADDTAAAGVTVSLYRDTNGNGVLDASDTLIGSTKTSSTGAYSFAGLAAGHFLVTETVPTGDVQTGPSTGTYYSLNLTAGQQVSGQNFDNFQAPTTLGISNVSYHVGSSAFSSLYGNTRGGQTVSVTFTVTNPLGEQLSLVSYVAPSAVFTAATAAQQKLSQASSAFYKPGTYTISVQLPSTGHYQVDFVAGAVINTFGPAGSNIFYALEDRLISSDNE